MYLEPPIAKSTTRVRPKKVGRAPGGGLQIVPAPSDVSFSRCRDDVLLDTNDLCLLYGCSRRTVYRWMAEHNLTPSGRAGREYYFEKRVIVDWDANHRPSPGRNVGR